MSSIRRGSVLLAGSAVLGKLLGLLRDRIFLDTFGGAETVDLIFAAFRIPDFFFYLLVGGTISLLFVPRISDLEKKEADQFLWSFVWAVVTLFGLICLFASLAAPILVKGFAGGFSISTQAEIIPLARMLFGSVFLLSISAVFAAFLQSRERFFALALAPLLYTGTICAVTWGLGNQFGIVGVGLAAISGALLHLLITAGTALLQRSNIELCWKKPLSAWKKFGSDFWMRVGQNAAFQINQSLDVLIASFLLAGSVTAFSLGSNLAHALIMIIPLPVANAIFPRLSALKKDPVAQKKLLKKATLLICAICIPASIIGIFIAEPLLQLLFNLESQALEWTKIVFIWTTFSLPFACLIPVFSRTFFANGDSKTPFLVSAISLGIATALAAYLSLVVLPIDQAIWGLAIGNLTANVLSAVMFGGMIWKNSPPSGGS